MAHNIEALRERFGNLLDALCHEHGLGECINGGCPEDVDWNWCDSGYQGAADHYGIWTGTGATKYVIGTDDCDYIIKFCPCADDYDYCAREVEVYEEAVRAGHADKFAWCAKLFDYDFNESFNLPVYVMEWCQCDYNMISDEMDDYHYTKFCSVTGYKKGEFDSYDKYTSDYKYERDLDEKMMEWAYSVWGLDYNAPVAPEAGMTIAQFMRKMYINDLHAGNWGWCNNRLVLTDYSGYGDCYSGREINY